MYKSGPTAKVFKSYKQIKKIASLLNDILRNNVLGQRCLQKNQMSQHGSHFLAPSLWILMKTKKSTDVVDDTELLWQLGIHAKNNEYLPWNSFEIEAAQKVLRRK